MKPILILTIIAWSQIARAECCSSCGSHANVRAYCRPICTTRRVEVTDWDVASDPICVACNVRPRNRLMRKTILREVPVVEWRVEYLCADCRPSGTNPHSISRPMPHLSKPPGRARDSVPVLLKPRNN